MTGAAPRLARRVDLDLLQGDLVELALGGTVAPEPGVRDWLEAAGVSRQGGGKLVVADEDWLAFALPSVSADELLTRSLLREPLYRLHVDLLVAEVATAIGRSGRWARLEELVFGDLAALSPRLSALTQLGRAECGGWEISTWSNLDALPRHVAAELDQRCWGLAGNAEAMFPILRTRYPPFASIPVFLASPTPLAKSILAAAAAGEAFRLAAGSATDLAALARQGLPIWWRPLGGGTLEVTLAAPCRARGKDEAGGQSQPFSLGVPSRVRAATALLSEHSGRGRSSFWEVAETSTWAPAFVGAASREGWPADEDAARRGLPSGEALTRLAGARQPDRTIPDAADEAFRSLACHPLFGFWVQVLLLEALDRELGDESLLLFALSPLALADPVEAATRVFYQPRSEAAGYARAMLGLGALDPVMGRVAAGLGVQAVAVLGDSVGPWSLSLALLAGTGIVEAREERWAFSAHALDRLHGGGLMTAVIRRGRTFRERLQRVLETLWRERAEAAKRLSNA